MANTHERTPDPDDYLSTSGSGALPAELRRLPQVTGESAPADGLDRQIAQMLMLHPEIALEFRGQGDLAEMDEGTKRLLLADIYTVLEIDPTLGISELHAEGR
jgi:hypothetical protein